MLSNNKQIAKIQVIICIFSLAYYIGIVNPLGFSKKHQTTGCSGNNIKLLSLLNLLCNTTQNTSITTRDACYGCFFRAGNLPPSITQLSSLSQCATIYLNNTSYNACASTLAALASGIQPTVATPLGSTLCYTGYCDFVRCVRRVNSNQLIDQCFLTNLVNRDLSMQANRIAFYLNVTSCVLAQARCSQYNPITGELQQQFQQQQQQQQYYYGGLHYSNYYLFNSLQITSTGDIRIVSFPGTVGVADYFCSMRNTLEQSTFQNSIC